MGGGDIDDAPTLHASDTRRCCGGMMAMMRWPNVFQARRIRLKRVRSRTAEQNSLAIRCTACLKSRSRVVQMNVMHKSEQMSSSASPVRSADLCGPFENEDWPGVVSSSQDDVAWRSHTVERQEATTEPFQ